MRRLKKIVYLFLSLPLLLALLLCLLLWVTRTGPLPTSAFMLQHQWRALFSDEVEHPRHSWVALEEIPRAMQLAVIASEDQLFPVHRGIDVAATRAAIDAYRAGVHSGGGSTITQQVAKNLFLWGDRSTLRKVIEWGLALLLEMFWSKERILEVYLNLAQFGRQEYGVGAAAEYLLDKPVSTLTRADAALLAAALPAPHRFDVRHPSPYMRQRQAFILRQMNNLGDAYLLRLQVQ